MTASSEARRVAALAARAAAERKAQDVVAIDVSDVLAISDAFVIASADNDRQVRSIVDEVDEQLSACLLYTSPSPRDKRQSRMPSSA